MENLDFATNLSQASQMSEETKKYMENEKILAARLMKDKPEGMEGLRFVIEEIMLAQQQGLIRKKENE